MSAESHAPIPLLPTRVLVSWAALLAAALAIAIGLGAEGVDYPTPFAVAHAFRLLVGAELFFLLVLAPLLAPSDHAQPGLLNMLLLLCLGAPAIVVAAWVSDCDLSQVVASQAYLAAAALFVAGFLRVDRDRRLLGWYWLALGALGAGAPFVAFIAEDLLRARVEWLCAASPFWVADRLCRVEQFAWEWAAPAAALLLLAAALLAFPFRARLRTDALRGR
ncbi:MAG TPA: hypothetical protein VNE39_22015 [Planctomycetota bacterium]|nr:hypothetical protein [Planctomycetota bacterium]